MPSSSPQTSRRPVRCRTAALLRRTIWIALVLTRRRVSALRPLAGEATDAPRRRRISARWRSQMDRMVAYRDGAGGGSCEVPQKWEEDPPLGRWVWKQRVEYKRMLDGDAASSMFPEKAELLRREGFVFRSYEKAWRDRYEQLVAYEEKHGDCLVPSRYSADPKLGVWVAEQRRHYRARAEGESTVLTDERIDLLDRLGFAWDAGAAAWEDRFGQLVRYKEEHGDCRVLPRTVRDPAFVAWIKHQRDQYKLYQREPPASQLTAAHISRLSALGFVWDPRQSVWDARFAALRAYQKRTGTVVVRTNDGALGRWVSVQRVQYGRRRRGLSSTLTNERIRDLDAVGFVWRVGGYSWYDCYDQLVRYVRQNGNTQLPTNYWDGELVRWVEDQQLEYTKFLAGVPDTDLTEDRVACLDRIGFDWGEVVGAWRYRSMNSDDGISQ